MLLTRKEDQIPHRYATDADYLAGRSARREKNAARDAEFRSQLRFWSTPLVSGYVTLHAVHPDSENAKFPGGWTYVHATRLWLRVIPDGDTEKHESDARKSLGEMF